jgi:hypothetical protein
MAASAQATLAFSRLYGEAQMTMTPVWPMTAGRYYQMRASSADRERTIVVLQKSFVEGRLTRDELDERLGQALMSRDFNELMDLVADLPVGLFGRLPAHPPSPQPRKRERALPPLVAALAWLAVVCIVFWAIVAA